MSLLRSVLTEQAAYGRAALAAWSSWPSGGSGRAVVLVPGLGAHPHVLVPLARALAASGAGPLVPVRYSSLRGGFDAVVEAVQRTVVELDEPVDLVGHSLGGLAGRVFLKRGGDSRVRRFVSLSAPQQGTSLWRLAPPGLRSAMDPDGAIQRELAATAEPVPTLSVGCRHDHQVVPSVSAAIAGGEHHTVEVGHTAVLYDPHVQRLVVDFLERRL